MRRVAGLLLVVLVLCPGIAGCLQSSEIASSDPIPDPLPEDEPEYDPEPEPLDRNFDHDGDGFTTGWELDNGWDPEDIISSPACNSFRELCSRGVNETVWATTHNSHASYDRNHNILSGSQRTNITAQMQGGIRVINLDVHEYNNQSMLCHGGYDYPLHPCFISGNWPLEDAFLEVLSFLENNSFAILIITLESYITAQDLANASDSTQLTPYFHSQELGAPWPTLATLIESGKRVILFSQDRPEVDISWYHYDGDYMAKTHWAYNDSAYFTCELTRGNVSSPLRWLDHFVTDPLSSESASNSTNQVPVVVERANNCTQQWGQVPNFIAVDFWGQGNIVLAVETLNGF
ncbi:MAG: hypothetical protein NZ774_02920 [Candidatus Poseidoniales archaeon]|nr:hypothetical protein [Candidatus Poseidoniales archaeon]